MSFFNGLGKIPEYAVGVDPASPNGDFGMVALSEVMPNGGLKLIACEHLPKTRRAQFRFPRSKKKRMRKKWAKKAENWREVDATGDIYFVDLGMAREALIHPDGFERLKKHVGVIRNVGTVGAERKG